MRLYGSFVGRIWPDDQRMKNTVTGRERRPDNWPPGSPEIRVNNADRIDTSKRRQNRSRRQSRSSNASSGSSRSPSRKPSSHRSYSRDRSNSRNGRPALRPQVARQRTPRDKRMKSASPRAYQDRNRWSRSPLQETKYEKRNGRAENRRGDIKGRVQNKFDRNDRTPVHRGGNIKGDFSSPSGKNKRGNKVEACSNTFSDG